MATCGFVSGHAFQACRKIRVSNRLQGRGRRLKPPISKSANFDLAEAIS